MALTLYLDPNHPDAGSWIEAELKDMTAGYDRKWLSPPEAVLRFGEGVQLPVLQDGPKTASGQAALMDFLKEYRKFVDDWRLFQGDSCYIREDGSC